MKKLSIIIIIAVFVLTACAGMPTIQWKTANQQQIAKLAVSIGAKAIGLKLKSQGFIWTPEIEGFYKMITSEDKFSLDAAKLAERYIKENVNPILQDDILELAQMIGVEFNSNGEVSGVKNVKYDLLKTAAIGFRMAVM
jgi:hypothetical protein